MFWLSMQTVSVKNLMLKYKGRRRRSKKARYNSGLLDIHILTPGYDTEDIPDSYVIFITENDVMKGKQSIYP